MGNVFSWLGDTFSKIVTFMKSVWNSFMDLVANNIIVQIFESVFSTVLAFARKVLGALTPQFIIDALNKAKAQREAPAKKQIAAPSPERPELPQADTEGLGSTKKEKKDIYGDEILKLNELIEAQRAYLKVLDGTPEEISAVAAAEKAAAIILELDTKLLDEKRPALTSAEKATIRYKVALEESLKALNEHGRSLSLSSTLPTCRSQQTRALADRESRRRRKQFGARPWRTPFSACPTTGQRRSTEAMMGSLSLATLNALLARKQSTELVESVNKEIVALQQEIAMRKICRRIPPAQFVEVQRQAALVVKSKRGHPADCHCGRPRRHCSVATEAATDHRPYEGRMVGGRCQGLNRFAVAGRAIPGGNQPTQPRGCGHEDSAGRNAHVRPVVAGRGKGAGRLQQDH